MRSSKKILLGKNEQISHHNALKRSHSEVRGSSSIIHAGLSLFRQIWTGNAAKETCLVQVSALVLSFDAAVVT